MPVLKEVHKTPASSKGSPVYVEKRISPQQFALNPEVKQQTACDLSCGELIQEYGAQNISRQEMNLLLNVKDNQIEAAFQSHDALRIIDSLKEKNCILKWKKCMIDINDIEQTRKRIELTNPEEAEKL